MLTLALLFSSPILWNEPPLNKHASSFHLNSVSMHTKTGQKSLASAQVEHCNQVNACLQERVFYTASVDFITDLASFETKQQTVTQEL